MFEQYDIVYVKNQGDKRGSVQSGARPAVILQNNKGNHFSPTTIIAYITGKEKKKELPVHVILSGYNLTNDCTVLLEQIMTVPKADIESKIDRLRYEDKLKVDKALRISLGQK